MATATAFANANTVVSTGWTNASNAYADDGSYATAAPAKSTSITTDYGFPTLSIPPLSTITNVTFEFQYKSDTTSSTGAVIGIQGNDNGSLMGSETTFGMSLTDVTQTKAYTTSLPTVTNLNTANTVRCRIRGFRSTSNTAITWSVDYVKITVTYTPGYQLSITGGSYAYTGGAMALKASRMLPVATGAYVYTGGSVGLAHGFQLAVAGGTYAYTGGAVGLTAARSLAVAGGTYAYSGGSVGLRAGRRIVVDQGAYAYTGNDVGLLYEGDEEPPARRGGSLSLSLSLRF